MKEKLTKAWLSCWLYVITLISGAILGLLFANRHSWDLQTKVFAIATALLPIHVLEEWHFPGGFHVMYNLMSGSEDVHRYPMNQLSDMWTNFIGVVFGCAVLIAGVRPLFLVMQLFLCLMEVAGHAVSGARFMKKRYGRIYNPGLATTLLGYVPVAAAIVYIFVAIESPTLGEILLGLLCGAILGGFSLKGVEAICKSRETPYGYTWGEGYFRRFREGDNP